MEPLNQKTLTIEATDLAVSNNKKVIRILQVDDDASFLELFKQILMDMGNFEVDSICCVDEAFKKLAA
jgi:hypothetical protein